MQFLKQSTGATVEIGPILDSSGAAVTGAVIADLNITKNGSTAAMSGNTFTHSHNGHYLLTLTTTDTDTLGRLSISANNSAHAMPVFRYTVLVAAMFDAIVTNGNVSILDAAGVRSAVGLATANLDTQLSTIDDFLDTEIAAIKAKTDNLPNDPADASDISSAFGTVNSTLATIAGYIDTEVAAIKAKTDNLPADPADASDIAASFAALNTKVDTIDDFLDTEIAAIKAKTDNLPTDPADQSAVEAAILAAWTTAITESYSTDGSPPTPAQALMMILQALTEKAISGTTMTVKKLDGSTTAFTLTLNDATTPTSVTRAS